MALQARTWIMIAAAVVIGGGAVGTGLAFALKHNTPKKIVVATTLPPTTVAPAPVGPPCPLTGAPSPTGSVPNRPALAIKVDNYPAGRPQSGLDKADIVFEVPVEAGITRLIAVFQCQDASQVGPIRSARATDAPVLDQLSHPLFIHAGGISPVISLLGAANLVDDNIFWHASIEMNPPGRSAPYDTYTSTSDGWGLNPSDTSPPAPLFTYSSTAPTGAPVTSVHIPFSTTSDVTWTWSTAGNDWLLSYAGSPATVAGGTQIGVTNVIVQRVNVTYGPWVESGCCSLEVQSQVTGSGPLEVFRNSEEITGTWQRASTGAPTSLVATDGTVIPLDPGHTWVELVPSAIAVTAH